MKRIFAQSILCASLLAISTAHAATYFVRNGGDDAADGLSHDTAWATLDKVNAFDFSPGDRVLFHEGGRWQGQLIVDWPGTESKGTIVSAYRLEDGLPVWGYETERPIIDGTDSEPATYDGLVRVTASRVRIQNLAVVNSEGRGIQFENADHGEVIGCLTDNTYKSGIKFIDSDFAVIRRNSVTRAGVAFSEDGADWGGAIELVASDDGEVYANTVVEVYGEGINANDGSTGSMIEANFVFAARSAGIYVDAAPATTVRRNVVLGTANPEFWRMDQTTGPGILLNNEEYHYTQRSLPTGVQSRGARIYGNIVAYTRVGVGFWGQLSETTFDDTLIINNTLVDNDTQLQIREKPKDGSLLINNILLSLSPGTVDVDRSDLSGMTASHNYFSQGDPGGDLSHPGNVYEGLDLTRMSGWRSIVSHDEVNVGDFAMVAGSAAIGAGDDRPREIAQAPHDFDVDMNGLTHGTPMDLGALHFPGYDYKVPKHPVDVIGRP